MEMSMSPMKRNDASYLYVAGSIVSSVDVVTSVVAVVVLALM